MSGGADSRLYGLIGYPLTHSFSKKFFSQKFLASGIEGVAYENFPITSIAELPGLIAARPNLHGLNVTIPYKEAVLPYLDSLDETAGAIGAVNTIKFTDGTAKGFNTDVFGFMHALMKLIQPRHTAALILGTGGASKAVAYGLKKMGIEFDFVSRNPDERELHYQDLSRDVMQHYKIIVNTTPLGMHPDYDACPPLPYDFITPAHLLFDLIYNPDETLFLKNGSAQGALTSNGLEMLHLQAEQSWKIWNS